MPATTNGARVSESFEAWNEAGLGAIRMFYAEDLVYHPREDEPDSSLHVGRESFEELIKGFVDAFSKIIFEVHEIIDSGDVVIADTTLNGHGATSGVEVHDRYVFVYRLRDGLIAEGWEYRTLEEALAAHRPR